MQVTDTTYYNDMDFADYLAINGTSFSSLKDMQITPTVNMQLGTRVHNFLLEPDKYDWQQTEIVRPMAAAIREVLGSALACMDKEIAFTCNMHHNGLVLPYKGRADLLKAGRIVIDLKILAGSIQPAVERFGYDRQISGYCLATGATVGLIVSYNKAKKKVETKLIKPSADFWEYTICERGMPVLNQIT
jgi:hypothetical protein